MSTPSTKSFKSLITNAGVVSSLEKAGLTEASTIQSRALEALQGSQDLVINGAPKTGKTYSYLIHLATSAKKSPKDTTVVIAPSPAAATDIGQKFMDLGAAPDAAFILTAEDAFAKVRDGIIAPATVATIILDEVGGTFSPASIACADRVIEEAKAARANLRIIVVGRTANVTLSGTIRKFLNAPLTIDAEVERAVQTNVVHSYFEVGAELLSKPTLLADLLAASPTTTAAIFCNSPSDVDFVEVMLRKRGIGSTKLIGNVPPPKVIRAMQDLKNGLIQAFVITDISVRGVEIEAFDYVINYSIPSDPEVYLHRMGDAGKRGKTSQVISLMAPLELTNFHYLKKFVQAEFVPGVKPAPVDVAVAEFNRLEASASASTASSDSRFTALAGQVLASPKRDAILAHLIYSTIELLPKLSQSSAPAYREEGEMRDEDGSDGRRDRYGRGDRRDGGRGGDRRDGGRGRDRRGGGRGREEFPRDGVALEGAAQAAGNGTATEGQGEDFSGGEGRRFERGERGSRDDRGERNDRGDRGDDRRERRAPLPPPVKTTRVYLSAGKRQGMSHEEIVGLITKAGDVPADVVRRTSVRSQYSFVDLPEEQADGVIEKLKASSLANGTQVTATKATVIPEPRLAPVPTEDSQAAGNENPPPSAEPQAEAAGEVR